MKKQASVLFKKFLFKSSFAITLIRECSKSGVFPALLKSFFQPTKMDITVQELKQKLDSGAPFVFIDVREPYEYQEFNLGAKLIPLGSIMGALPDLESHKNDEIVVHCRSGQRSGMAQQLLQASGFTNVRNLLGGVLAWKEVNP